MSLDLLRGSNVVSTAFSWDEKLKEIGLHSILIGSTWRDFFCGRPRKWAGSLCTSSSPDESSINRAVSLEEPSRIGREAECLVESTAKVVDGVLASLCWLWDEAEPKKCRRVEDDAEVLSFRLTMTFSVGVEVLCRSESDHTICDPIQ